MSAFEDLIGKKFGLLRVVRRVLWKGKPTIWYCTCDCGNEAVVHAGNLVKGHTKSCGCLQSEITKTRSTTHGLRKHPLYGIWKGIHERCYKEYSNSYKNYGAKGVTVCSQWFDFKTFFNWATTNGWQKKLQIDKDIIPKKLGIPAILYSPEMCSIVTPKTNMRTTSKTKIDPTKAELIRKSKKKTSELVKEFGVCKTTINNIKSGYSWAS